MTRRHRQRGQVLPIIAIVAVVLLGFVAIAADLGIGMADRRDLQAYADSAALAGVREYNQGRDANSAHLTALLYLHGTLPVSSGFTFPLQGRDSHGAVITCTQSPVSCPAGTYTVGPNGEYSVTLVDSTGNVLDVGIAHSRRTLVAGVLGFQTSVSGTAGRAAPTQAARTPVGYTLAALNGDIQVNGGGTTLPTGDVSGLVYTTTTFGANNTNHIVQMPQYVSGVRSDGTTGVCASPGVANEVDSNGTTWSKGSYYQVASSPVDGTTHPNTSPPSTFPGMSPVPPAGQVFATAAAGWDAAQQGYKPGTYRAVLPQNATLLPGVFAFVGIGSKTTIDMTGWHNAIAAASPGLPDVTGAVAIVLDSTDLGDVLIKDTVLNGIDATSTANDPLGTHNFVIYGETYQGGVTVRASSSNNLTGIIDTPHSAWVPSGNPDLHVYGALYAGSVDLNGGGNGTITFTYVCGLNAVDGSSTTGGLIR